jgi:hypothetical protein
MHFLIRWGCVISALITFPLVFGWVHFKLEGELGYRAYVFGFPLNVMQGRSLRNASARVVDRHAG